MEEEGSNHINVESMRNNKSIFCHHPLAGEHKRSYIREVYLVRISDLVVRNIIIFS